ncbi:hypothetical protein GCM10027445_43850 [Amycolatopsis endophytica]|uniref:Myo-inositol catabolism protein IolC n=1 Tax=Amycolatopsis endophytica TaxID=860233 RepID=A0A853BD09_9PSEU|nr:DUF2090 domain-containing protein [Amycolatopsis endophytica]NYI93253.1 myo-inositol catabolism protein IolC [Amycolatopsis endophytica]
MTPLYTLAMDQRLWLKKAVFGTLDLDTAQTAELTGLKQVIADGAIEAVRRGGVAAESAAVLIDEELGGEAPARIKQAGLTLSMALEKSQDCVYEEEPRSASGELLAQHRPDLPKVLVRYNPETADATAREQLVALASTADRVRAAGLPFLVELLVVPTEEQVRRAGSPERFETEALPGLTLSAIDDIKAAGVHAQWWKVEGMPDADRFAQVLDRCRTGADHRVEAVVLGKAAPQERVERWLSDAAAAGFAGFAIGRSIWWEAVRQLRAGTLDRAAAVDRIATLYLRNCAVMSAALGEHAGV